MKRSERIANYALYTVFGALVLLVVWMLIPYWTYLFFGALLAFAFYPLNKLLAKKSRTTTYGPHSCSSLSSSSSSSRQASSS
ncbi:MAG: hypothetical protein HC945_00290 [Nitrosarchaeum sp.]|nr:hypothetical protein [Nitrosarchaeum sp.]